MLASSYDVTMMVDTRGVEVGICGFHLSVVVGTSASSCARIIFCALTWVILWRNGNGDGHVKGSRYLQSTSLLDKSVTANVDTVACGKSSCVITRGDISRMHTASASIASSAMALISSSIKRLSRSVSVATTVAETDMASLACVLVDVES